jgi:hypothetical protein
MIGLNPKDSWDKANDAEIQLRMTSSGTSDYASEARIQRFALRMLERKGVSSLVRNAIQSDPNVELRLKRIYSDQYKITVEYRDVAEEAKAKAIEEDKKGELWDAEEYLKGITFTKHGEEITKRLMETVGASLDRMERAMMEALAPIKKGREPCTEEQKKEWITCEGGCADAAKKDIQRESTSTAYFLRCLAQSVFSLNGDGTQRVEFDLIKGQPSELTGRWEEDISRFGLVSYGPATTGGRKGRLVMGFGPSAAGKTYLTRMLLKLLRQADPLLPEVFITVDGDKYRESSFTYKKVTDVASAICAEGFSNLMSAGLKSFIVGSLFDSSAIKKATRTFLEAQRIPIHLYVPHTLSKCGMSLSCESEYTPYKEITGDERWIGMMIWQHKTGEECNFPPGYQCKGCKESGEARQKENGKKYSGDAWEDSMKYGKQEVVKAPGGAYLIHNSGGNPDSKTVILDVSKEIDSAKEDVFGQESGKVGSQWVYYIENQVQKEIDDQNTVVKEMKGKKMDEIISRKQELSKPNYHIYRALYPEEMDKIDKEIEALIKTASTRPA